MVIVMIVRVMKNEMVWGIHPVYINYSKKLKTESLHFSSLLIEIFG